MYKKISVFLIDILIYTLGSFIYSTAVTVFISSNEISPGGLTGIATVLNYLFMLPSGIMLFILNIPLLILGFVKFGGIFIIKTAIATTIMSLTLEITDAIYPTVAVDKILASVFGGILMGVGISLVMLRGATTGGVDIAAKLINRRFPHITVGRIMLMMDAFVIIIATLAYRNVESALYSVIAMYATSRVMDMILYGADKGKIVYIITAKAKEMADDIMSVLGRGVTLINVVGGYTGTEKKMLMCTVRRHEVSALYKITWKNDSTAFIIVGEAGEVIGEGFKKIEY